MNQATAAGVCTSDEKSSLRIRLRSFLGTVTLFVRADSARLPGNHTLSGKMIQENVCRRLKYP